MAVVGEGLFTDELRGALNSAHQQLLAIKQEKQPAPPTPTGGWTGVLVLKIPGQKPSIPLDQVAI